MTDTELRPLPLADCLVRLRETQTGRIAVVVHDFPIVLPINYRLVETSGLTWVAFRTRAGNVIDRAPMNAALEIDGIDHEEQRGWSVLVRGTLHHVDPDSADFRDRFDPEPWLGDDRDSWMVIVPFAITGRVLIGSTDWEFRITAET